MSQQEEALAEPEPSDDGGSFINAEDTLDTNGINENPPTNNRSESEATNHEKLTLYVETSDSEDEANQHMALQQHQVSIGFLLRSLCYVNAGVVSFSSY